MEEKHAPPARVVRSRFRDRDYGLRRGLLIGDMAALSLALFVSLSLGGDRDGATTDALWFLITLPGWAFLFSSYQLYRRPIQSFEPTHLDDLSRLFHAMVLGTLGLWVFYKLIPPAQLTFEEVSIFWLLGFSLTAMLRRITRRVNLNRHGAERVFLIASNEDALVMKRKLGNHPEYEMELAGVVTGDPIDEPVDDSRYLELEDVEELLATHQIDHLIVRLDCEVLSETSAEELMYACFRYGVRFGAYPGPRSLLLPGVQLNHIEGMGILTHDPPILSRSDRLMKRLSDIVLSFLLLIVAAPLMLIIAVVIKLDSKGTILFRQMRVGRDGVRFKLNKFRTMVPDAEAMTAELMEKSTDPNWLFLEEDLRITKVGRYLRRTSLDELPQLWNVLRGDMSMVGPRPLSERDDEGLQGWERHRLDLVPGITGHWQVLGRTSIPFKEMVEIDYAYVTSWSLWLDAKILIRTVPMVLSRRGAN